MQFYTQGTQNIRPELLGTEAEAAAKKVLNVSPTQMRRIFNQIKSLFQRLEKGESWDKIAPLVQLQKAHIAYTVRRGKKNNSKFEKDWVELEDIIKDGLGSVKTENDYKAFVLFFEALYGFYYAETPQRI